jgi:hypothetical protein
MSCIYDVYAATDQPETCPHCGARTDFEELADDRQLHRCLDATCGYRYIVTQPEEEPRPLCCTACRRHDFVAYEMRRCKAKVNQDGSIDLRQTDEPPALDEVVCADCGAMLWQGTLDQDADGSYRLPQEASAAAA